MGRGRMRERKPSARPMRCFETGARHMSQQPTTDDAEDGVSADAPSRPFDARPQLSLGTLQVNAATLSREDGRRTFVSRKMSPITFRDV